MSFLLTCPHCGPARRERVQVPGRGEPRGRRRGRRLRELTTTSTSATTSPGVQREWWYHRAGCGLWFLAERDTRTNEVAAHRVPPTLRPVPGRPTASRLMRLGPSPASGSTARRGCVHVSPASRSRGFAGDTIGSALFATGRRVFSRSFKYHRPRGLLCCTGQLRRTA